MEDDLTPYELGSHAGLVLRYAVVIVAAVALFRLLMRQVRARTLNAVLGALAIFIVFAGGVVALAGEQFGRGDAVGLLVLAVVMIYEVWRMNKRFRAGKTFR
jgi:hypothetical protein